MHQGGFTVSVTLTLKTEVEFDLLKDQTKLPPHMLPPVVKLLGLDLERKNYLYKEIRQFCKPESANPVAPRP